MAMQAPLAETLLFPGLLILLDENRVYAEHRPFIFALFSEVASVDRARASNYEQPCPPISKETLTVCAVVVSIFAFLVPIENYII
jgi:hypothetical protein